MPAQKPPVPPEPQEEQSPPTSAGAEDAVWAARRADLEWRSRLDRVTVTYRLHAATAATEYHQAVLQITQEAAEREAAALSSMESASRRPEASVEDRFAAAQEQQGRLLAGRQSSQAALLGAAGRLATELQRAWLEALDGYHEAHAQYQRALHATGTTSPLPGAGAWLGAAGPRFAVAGDEGPPVVQPPVVASAVPGAGAWLGAAGPRFAVAGDEGPPVVVQPPSAVIWPGA